MNEQNNFSASGSATISGGVYGKISVSGSARASQDITCDELHVSGSARLDGNVEAGECHVSGSAHFGGALTGKNVHISGSCTVDAGVDVEGIKISGSMKTGGGMHGGFGQFSGGVSAVGDVEFEELKISGAIHCDGLLSADRLFIKLGGTSNARDVGGDEIAIKISDMSKGFFSLFGSRISGSFTTQSIEGTTVELEYTKCDVVRGKDIVIGEGCEIKRVAYQNSITVNENASVGERVKV